MSQWDLDVLAASLRRDADDLSLYAGFLLNSLSGALPPDLVRVERKSGMFARLKKGEPPVVEVSVTLGDRRYALRREDVGRTAVASIAHESGGIVMKTDTVPVHVWSEALAAALADYARTNAAAAQALTKFTAL